MRKQRGITLIEIMLVLMLAAAVILLSIRQFDTYKRDNEVRAIQANIDQLFQGLAMYYQANCRNPYDSSGNPITNGSFGTLDPNHSPVPQNPYSVLTIASGTNSLIANGDITQWSPLYNSMVDTSYGDSGYSVQFNNVSVSSSRTPAATFYTWVGGDSANMNKPTSISFSSTVGTIYIWQSHIALKLLSTLDPVAYKGRLGATCSSDSPTTPCSSATTTGPYIIWESLPSAASPSSTSNLAPFMPTVKAFTNLYYTNDMYGAETGQASANNYLCGG